MLQKNCSMAFTHALIRVLVFWFCFMAAIFMAGSGLSLFLNGDHHRIVYGVAGTACVLLCTWFWSNRRWDRMEEYGLRWSKGSFQRFLVGLFFGALLILVLWALLIWLTPLSVHAKAFVFTPAVGYWVISLILFAFMEEVAFRGLPLVELTRKYGFLTAQFIVAIAFALYHVVYGWPWMVAFMGPFVWAFIFGLARVQSGGVAMPTGIHIALNAGQIILGMKPEAASVFELDVPSTMTPAIQSQIDLTGLGIQIVIGLIGIAATFLYQRRNTDIAG